MEEEVQGASGKLKDRKVTFRACITYLQLAATSYVMNLLVLPNNKSLEDK